MVLGLLGVGDDDALTGLWIDDELEIPGVLVIVFAGDDTVWAFVNGKIDELDLGGSAVMTTLRTGETFFLERCWFFFGVVDFEVERQGALLGGGGVDDLGSVMLV